MAVVRKLKALFLAAAVVTVSPREVSRGGFVQPASAEERGRPRHEDIIAALQRELPALGDDMRKLVDLAASPDAGKTATQITRIEQRTVKVQTLLRQEKETPFLQRNFAKHAALEAGEASVRKRLAALVDQATGKMTSTPELRDAHAGNLGRLSRIRSAILPKKFTTPRPRWGG